MPLTLDALPAELLSEILCSLSANVVVAEGCCRRWRSCVQGLSDDDFWQSLCHQLSPLIAPRKLMRATTWRALYAQHLAASRAKRTLTSPWATPETSEFNVAVAFCATTGRVLHSSVVELQTDDYACEVASGACHVPMRHLNGKATLDICIMRKSDGKILNLSPEPYHFNVSHASNPGLSSRRVSLRRPHRSYISHCATGRRRA